MNTTKKETIILLAILLIAFLFRYIGIATPSINGDEGDNFDSVRELLNNQISPWQRWAGLLPPMSTWSITVFVKLLGESEFSLRFFGIFFGTLTTLVIYLLAKLQYGIKTAQVSAVLAAVLPLLAISNRDAHPDNVLIFFSILAIFLFELARKKESNKTYFLGGIFAGIAIISKNNAIPFLFIYWILTTTYDVLNTKNKLPQLITNLKKALIVLTGATSSITLSFGLEPSNPFYFFHGIIYWIINQNVNTGVPWHYSLAILFDALSPAIFILLPIAIMHILKNKTREDYLNSTICIFFILFVAIQSRKFPRHFLLAMPFATIILARFLTIIEKTLKNKKLKTYFNILIMITIIFSAGWTIYKIIPHQEYTVWKEAGNFILSNTEKNTTIYIDGIDYWTLKFYTNYKYPISSRLKTDSLKIGDLVIIHKLKETTPFFIGSPLQNDLTIYTADYAKQYKFNQTFYDFVYKHGQLISTFKYDKLGNEIELHKIKQTPKLLTTTTKNSYTTEKISNFDPVTKQICNIWTTKNSVKQTLTKILPRKIQSQITQKCSKGCVFTCDIF